MKRIVRHSWTALIVGLAAFVPACQSPSPAPTVSGPSVFQLMDARPNLATVPAIDVRVCETLAEQSPVIRAGGAAPRPYNVLVLSGGGAYGAYSAGVLRGWTESGHRPSFDVVTGVSTGALIATLAFLGPSRDEQLKTFYTTVKNDDVFKRRSDVRAVFSDAFADSSPLAHQLEKNIDFTLMKEVAAEYAKGRRLYIGTTHLESKRLVVWDMGAIAGRGGADDLVLFRRVLLASAAIPGFFPPVRIPVEIDGKPTEELHVDGGVTASLFFRPPQVPKDLAKSLGDRPLAGSNLYAIVAGKLYADPAPVERKLLSIVENSVSALLYAQTRGDLFQLFALTLATGMNYRMAAVPMALDAPKDATSFDPIEMTRLYEAGRALAKEGRAWRAAPPGLLPGEEVPTRGGPKLISTK